MPPQTARRQHWLAMSRSNNIQSKTKKINFLVEWDQDRDPLNPKNFHKTRKCLIVCVVSSGCTLVTCTSSIYTSGTEVFESYFDKSAEVVTLGLSLFVAGLAVGPMLFSPLSELYGRRPIYIVSMFFFMMFLIPCALAKNIQTILVGRFLDGVAGSAFLTAAGGTVADLFVPSEIMTPMTVYTLSPFFGPVLGPVIGGFIVQFASTWRWMFYVLLIWSGITFATVVVSVPETYASVVLHHKAAKMRKSTGNSEYHSASELANRSRSISNLIVTSLYRPVQLLVLEPLCLLLCTYTAFVLGIVYLFFGAFPLVFTSNHGFNTYQNGVAFLGLLGGNIIGGLLNPLLFKNYMRLVRNFRAANPTAPGEAPRKPDPEFRLPPTIIGSVLIPIGLFWFGWTTYSSVFWIVPIIGSAIFMTGAFLVFLGIFGFLVDAYPVYAASALAANTLLRCMFAAGFPLFRTQMYTKLGDQWATSLLGFLALVMMPFPYIFYKYGKQIRARSRFAISS